MLQAIESNHSLQQRFRIIGGDRRGSQPAIFLLELVIGERVVGIAVRMVDACILNAAIGAGYLDDGPAMRRSENRRSISSSKRIVTFFMVARI